MSTNNGSLHTIFGLPLPQFGRKDSIPCIRYDIEYTLRWTYLSEANACSHLCGHFFMGWKSKKGEPIRLNGAFHVCSMIMQFVMASAAEAKLGALYHNCQTGIFFQLPLAEMGHPQPKTPLHWDNTTAIGIENNSIKRQC
jgi:hypothetical protein